MQLKFWFPVKIPSRKRPHCPQDQVGFTSRKLPIRFCHIKEISTEQESLNNVLYKTRPYMKYSHRGKVH